MAIELNEDNIQHGLDDNPNEDAEKGAVLGGVGGAVVGAAAGSIAGPVGTVLGTVAGGLLGAGASGLAVGAVDEYDNDDTVSGIGDGTTSADVDPMAARYTPLTGSTTANIDDEVREFGLREGMNPTGEAPGVHPDPRAVEEAERMENPNSFDAEFGSTPTKNRPEL